MSENKRSFTEEEVKKAETLLLVLANESARFWAKALMSSSFLYQGEVSYCNSDFYKGSSWNDRPNENRDPITGEQIVKFMEVYMEEARKEIDRLIQDDMGVAKIIGKKERLEDVDWLGSSFDEYNFGGWDNDPWGEVAKAKTEAELGGPMSVNSPYRKTQIILCKGKIYRWHYGYKELLMTVDVQE